MTRKQRLTLTAAVIALFVATLKGFDFLQTGRTELGAFMLAAAGIGWVVLARRVLAIRRAPTADS